MALRQVVAPRSGATNPVRFHCWTKTHPSKPFDFSAHNDADQLLYLLRRLAEHMRKESRALDEKDTRFVQYKRLLEALAARFDLGIYALNYDTAPRTTTPPRATTWPPPRRHSDPSPPGSHRRRARPSRRWSPRPSACRSPRCGGRPRRWGRPRRC